MKITIIFVALIFNTIACANASEWMTDYNKALDQAEAQHKFVLLDFTGSDWCAYCKLLDSEVLTQPMFKEYAAQNLILVKVDLPHLTQLPVEVKQQNFGLKRKFQVHEFPTLIILTSEAAEVGRIKGYHPGSGPQAVIDQIKELIPKSQVAP